jgi:hypothetical protein
VAVVVVWVTHHQLVPVVQAVAVLVALVAVHLYQQQTALLILALAVVAVELLVRLVVQV